MLYHFSEEANIEIFKPRPTSILPKPVVWGIDKEHSLHYYFPRDCPRVIYWKGEHTKKIDKKRFFSNSSADKIIAVENRWLEQIYDTTLFVYSFHEDAFEIVDKTAGYFVSYEDVVPVRVEPVGNLLEKILSEKVEVRFTPDLYPLRNRIISSTLEFSIIRFGNAKKIFEV